MQESLTFWFDLENAPDVLFFEPIAKRLKEMNHTVYTTCRNYSDVPELAKLYGIEGSTVGWYGGKSKAKKIVTGLLRSALLGMWVRKKKIDLAVGFGSRPQAVTCGLLKIPSATIFDYEHVSISELNRFCNWIFVPQEVSTRYLTRRGTPEKKIIKYSGLKEEVYTRQYTRDKAFFKEFDYDEHKIIVCIRPPATTAHYHNHISVITCRRILERIADDSNILAIYLRRDNDDTFDGFFQQENIRKVTVPVKGLDLIANSDLVISGGGTMVREAVALGVPAYSIFTGQLGAVDEKLSNEGRLVLVRKPEDTTKIQFVKRGKTMCNGNKNTSLLRFFVNEFISLASMSHS